MKRLLLATVLLLPWVAAESAAWEKTCPHCSAEATDASQFCPDCGKRFSTLKACPGCGQKAFAESRFCPGCGQKFAFTSDDEERVASEMVKARGEYHVRLEKLTELYRQVGLKEKEQEAEGELASAREAVRIARAAAALESLAPAPIRFRSVGEADALYDEAEDLRRSPNLFRRREYLGRAVDLYQRILLRHPDSDKADDAAFRLGEIYETPFYENYDKSLDYYRKAFLWNPQTDFDARFKAAEIAHYRLKNKELAIALYDEASQKDPVQDNRRLAKERLQRLKDK